MHETANRKVEKARERFEMLQARLNAVKTAYLNRSPMDEREVTYEHVKQIAQEVIEANYELQRLLYGKVRLKLSTTKLIRRGR